MRFLVGAVLLLVFVFLVVLPFALANAAGEADKRMGLK